MSEHQGKEKLLTKLVKQRDAEKVRAATAEKALTAYKHRAIQDACPHCPGMAALQERVEKAEGWIKKALPWIEQIQGEYRHLANKECPLIAEIATLDTLVAEAITQGLKRPCKTGERHS